MFGSVPLIADTVGPQRYEHLGKLGIRNCEMFVSLKFDALYCNIDDYTYSKLTKRNIIIKYNNNPVLFASRQNPFFVLQGPRALSKASVTVDFGPSTCRPRLQNGCGSIT